MIFTATWMFLEFTEKTNVFLVTEKQFLQVFYSYSFCGIYISQYRSCDDRVIAQHLLGYYSYGELRDGSTLAEWYERLIWIWKLS